MLYVTAGSPFSRASGGEQRNSLIFDALSSLGDVDVLQLTPGPQTVARIGDAVGSSAVCLAEVRQGRSPFSRYKANAALTHGVEQALGRPLASYSLVVARRLWTACQLQLPQGLPLLADLDDLHYRYASNLRWHLSDYLRRLPRMAANRIAWAQLPRLDAAFFVSELDRREFSTLPGALLDNIPKAPRTPVLASALEARAPRVLFVGSLWYEPNRHGVEWFLSEVWPGLRARNPAAELLLVGAAAPAVRERWTAVAGVSAPGFVDDLDQAYRDAQVVVAPVHFGGGSNIKVLEALAHGRPCIASQFALQPFRDTLKAGEHLLCADSAGDFIDQINQVLRAPAAYEVMAETGRRQVEAMYNEQRFRTVVTEVARRLLKPQGQG